jgi:tRNA threonylcarbamoyladenosine biosynthesis protein TsaB
MTFQGLFRADLLLQQSRSVGPVLGLETGGPQASLAIASQGRILGFDTPPRRAHGESVVGEIEGLLRRCGLTVADLTAVAVGIGPGSFTGLRIALSYAKGVALATGCALAGIPSLDALALCALELPAVAQPATICPILDARKGELYAALYRRVDNGLEKISGEFLATAEDLARQLAGEQNVFFVGEGAAVYGDALQRLGGCVMASGPGGLVPPAAMISALGAMRIACGQPDRPGTLQPLYVRASEAELKAKPPAHDAGLEALWSKEKKNSSANI